MHSALPEKGPFGGRKMHLETAKVPVQLVLYFKIALTERELESWY